MNLPALEGDIIINDKGSKAFTTLEQSSNKAGKSLDQIQARADRVAASLTKLERSGTSRGLSGAFDKLPIDNLDAFAERTASTTDATARLNDSLALLGEARLSPALQSTFNALRNSVDDLSTRNREFGEGLERNTQHPSSKPFHWKYFQ